MNGWIKLHRKIQDKGYYKNSKFIHLWIHLLLKANHEPRQFMWNKEIIVIKEGQFITGRKQLSEETGISETSIERILNLLENEHQIGQQKTNKYRLITILNWKEYQTSGQENGQQTDNKWTTNGHKQEVKEYKELKEYIGTGEISQIWIKTWSRTPKIPEIEETQKLIDKFGAEKVERAMREASLSGFKNFKTFVDSLDENCNIKPKEKPEYIKKIENSTYKVLDSKPKNCENDCGKLGTMVMKDQQGRSWRVCSRKCFDEVVEKNKNAFESILKNVE